MTVEEAFNTGLIPASYKNIIPLKCRCGSDNEISDTLTRMWCPSERCYNKQISRMSRMLASFRVKGVGEEYCKLLWREMERVGLDESYVNVFNLKLSDYPDEYSKEVTIKRFNSIQDIVADSIYSGGYSFGELISNLSLPGLDVSAKKLFSECNSLDDFIDMCNSKYKEFGVYHYIASIFGYGIQTKQIIETIRNFSNDIIIAEKLFLIREPVSMQIQVAITGRISLIGNYTRKEFVKYCNELCSGKAEIIDAGASSSTVFVIADSPSNSSKYNYGVKRGILINSEQFIGVLKREVMSVE